MRSVRLVTFGCKANQYDTQLLREALVRRGLAEHERDADLVVVNTCTVTAEAGRKARQLVRRLHREEPRTKIAVTGCLAESEPEVLRELPGVEWVLGNGDAKRPAHFLRAIGLAAEGDDPEELGVPAGITAFAGHTRAFVKIQDGCDHRCAFCIIPSTRGPSRSRDADELEREVEGLVRSGFVEVVLCGIHIGHWGRERGAALADLLERLVALEPRDEQGRPLEFRLRLSSIEATEVCDRTVDLMASRPERLAPHLHMPLQAGDDGVLERMNRWYDRRTYLEACDRIRSRLDRPAFTADVLVGFPGETDEAFERTLDAVRESGFARLHVFPFSPRPGTAAWDMDGRVPPPVVRERRARLSEVAAEVGDAYRRGLAGVRERVVLEGSAGLVGRYQRVRVPPEDLDRFAAPPAAVDVRIEVPGPAGGPADATLVGRPV